MSEDMTSDTFANGNSDKHVDGISVSGEPEPVVVTPDMLYKLSKKIAQLTKVIYSLNTRNDDLEVDLEAVKNTYEEKLNQIAHNHATNVPNGDVTGQNHDIEAKSALSEAVHALQLSESKMKSMESDLQEKNVELKSLRSQLQNRNGTARPEHLDAGCQTASAASSDSSRSSPPSKSTNLLEQQVKQLNKEKKELTFKVDRLDVQKENFRLESETLKKEIQETIVEKNQLQLELSAARIQINYHKEVGQKSVKSESETDNRSDIRGDLDHAFTDELLQKIESLTNDKSELSQALQEAKVQELKLNQKLEASRQSTLLASIENTKGSKNRSQQTDSRGCEDCTLKSGTIQTMESQVQKLQSENSHYEQRLSEVTKVAAEAKASDSVQHESILASHRSETQQMQKRLERELEQSKSELEQLRDQFKSKQTELEIAHQGENKAVQQRIEAFKTEEKANREALEQLLAEKESLNKELSESKELEIQIKIQMGQASEKLLSVEEKYKGIEKERDDMKRKIKEFEAKMDVLTRSEQAMSKDANERLKQLEKALEEALIEREEILEAAEKEIQSQKTIAIETEQKMMDDFEWKLREIESDYRDKIKAMEDSVEIKVKSSRDELIRQKDEEFTRMSINIRREMEDNVRLERNSLKTALDAQKKAETEKAAELIRLEKDHEIRILQKSWGDEQDRLNRELQKMQRKVDDLPRSIESATRSLRSECDSRVQDERRKLSKVEEKHQEECDKIKDDMSGEILRVQAQCDEKISEYETKLELAHGNRMSSMFQMKEEVESEFTGRMEQLRDMYQKEILNQSKTLEEEKNKAKIYEENLRQDIKDKQQEIDGLNLYCVQREEELETKINDLLLRLQEQTALSIKLQAELDEYEWYEEEEEVEAGAATDGNKAEPYQRPASSRSRPHSRPQSTKPLEQHRFPSTNAIAEEAEAASEAAAANYQSMNSLYATAPSVSTASEVSSSSDSPRPPPRLLQEQQQQQPAPLAEETFLTSLTGAPPGDDDLSAEAGGSTGTAPTNDEDSAADPAHRSTSDQPQQHTSADDNIDETSETNTDDDDHDDEDDTEDENEDQSSKAQNWHQRLLKSASGVFQRGSSSPETSRQCVLISSTNFTPPSGLTGSKETADFRSADDALPPSSLEYYFLEAEAEDANSWASSASAPPPISYAAADEVIDLVTSNLTSVSKNIDNKNSYYSVWFISPQIIIALSILLILHVVMANSNF